MALLVGMGTIWMMERNIPDKEPVSGFRDVLRAEVVPSTADAYTNPQALIGDNASAAAHQPLSLGNSEMMVGDDQGHQALAPPACSEGVCANPGDDPNQSANKDPISKITKVGSAGAYGMGKSGVESFRRARFGGGQGVTGIDESTRQLVALDYWQAYFSVVTNRIRAAFPNAIFVREAASFADKFAQDHRLMLVWLILLTLIVTDVAESTVDSLDELVSKLLRRMFSKE